MNVTDRRCGKRGCRFYNGNIYFLWDSEDDTNNNGTGDDTPTLLPFIDLSLDKELEKERQMEKMDIETVRLMLNVSIAIYIICSKFSITSKV